MYNWNNLLKCSKYKKHRKLHMGCHWVYGTTVKPYKEQAVYDQEPGTDSERLAVLGATGSVKINAAETINKTLEADGNEYADREKIVPTDVEDKLSGNSAAENNPLNQDKLLGIESLNVSSKIYKLNNDPSAKYLIETNKKYADYHEFLSSDYLLERVKADPEKVSKRLGDGYFEQKFVIEQIAKLTGRPYLGDYGSDMEQFAALMEAGAVAAEELNLEIGVALTAEQMASLTSDIVWLVEENINGQKVLVPEVFLASVRAADLTSDGALIVGGDVAIYSKENIEKIGTIKADGTVDLKGENINNLGGRIAGENVKLDADKNITNKGGSIRARVDAILKGENVINEANVKESQYKGLNQKTVGNAGSISAGQNLSINAEKDIVNKGSVLAADKNLDFISGKDTNIKGGKLSGEKVTGNVGGDLNIESKQDKNSYEEKNSSAGFGIGIDLSGQNKKDSQDNLDKKDKVNNANKTGIFGSAGKSEVDSKYESVTDQSGIYAGKEGFDINVGEKTDLKGGIISSEAEKEKNKISTGTLTYEDIKNKAEYEAGSTGINVDTSAGAEHKDAGVTPNIGVGAKDDAESTTKATVSEGEIEIRDKENQKQDLSGLNRDTKNSLNKLGEIFDKTKVEERQELAGLFGEVAFNQIHYMKGTKEQKALYHALVGGIMSKLTSGDFLAGASATAINKLVIGEIEKIAGKDPAMMQWLSAGVGSIANELIDFNRWLGASVASSATKFNELAKKPESVQLAIYYDNFIGHVSLVIDGKEVNYGRYVKNSDINSSFGMIGEGAVIIYDDFSKRKELSGNKVYVYDLKLTESEGSKLVESFVNIVDNGGYNWSDKKTSNNQSEEDLEEHLIIDEAYRFNADSPYKVYCLYKRNCTTFTMDLLKSTLGENDSRIREIQDHIAPSTVLWNIVMDKEKVK